MSKTKKAKITIRERISDFVEATYSDYSKKILLADGFDEAFLGIGENSEGNPVAVYSIEKCLDILEQQFKDEEDPIGDAIDFFEFNVKGSYVGEFTPMFVNMFP
jgi:hypothetical protein